MGGVSVRVTAVASQGRERATPTVIVIENGIPTADGEESFHSRRGGQLNVPLESYMLLLTAYILSAPLHTWLPYSAMTKIQETSLHSPQVLPNTM